MKRRKAIGNVIAGALMVFLLIFTVSQLYIYNFNQLDNYNQVAQQVFATNAQKQNEHISISNAQVDNSGSTVKVTLTLANSGGITSQVTSVWIDDVDSSTSPHVRFPESIFIGAGLTATISGLDTGILTTANHKILVKVFTTLGNSASVELLPPGLAGTTLQTLALTQLTLVPPNPITSNDVVVVLTVTNSNSLGVAFTSLKPDLCIVQGRQAPVISTPLSGTASAGSTTTSLYDSTQNWVTNQWLGDIVVITSGTGAAQTGRITSNDAKHLNIISNPAWTSAPDATSKYSIRSDCHGSTPTTDSGTASGATSTTLSDSSKSWSNNEWVNYIATITSGTGSGQSRQIVSNTGSTGTPPDQLTVSPAWTTPPNTTSQYIITTAPCNINSGTANNAPVQCTLVQAAAPSSVSFLPPGGTVTFQWIYLLTTLTADSPITFTSSYVNTTTTIGLLTSPTNQIPSQTATVRGPGGASATTGGNFQQALGSLVNYFTSFQYSTDGKAWKVGFSFPANTNVFFRVNITNLSSKTIAFNSTSELLLLDLKTGSSTDYFIIKACSAAPNQPFYAPSFATACTVAAYPGAASISTRYIVGPSQTISLYFAATAAGGTNQQKSPVAGRDNLAIVAMIGNSYTGQNVVVTPGATSTAITFSSPLPTSSYTVIQQFGWTTTSNSYGSQTSTAFTETYAPAVPSSCSGQPCTFSYSVYGVGLNSPYAQAAPFFTVNT